MRNQTIPSLEGWPPAGVGSRSLCQLHYSKQQEKPHVDQ